MSMTWIRLPATVFVVVLLFAASVSGVATAEESIPVVPPDPEQASPATDSDMPSALAVDDRGAVILDLREQIRRTREEMEAGRSAALDEVDGAYRTDLANIDPKDMFETDEEYQARDAREKSEAALMKAKSQSEINRKFDDLLAEEVEPLFQRVRDLLGDVDVVPPDDIAVRLEKYDPELGVFFGTLGIDSSLMETKARIIFPMKREEARTFWKNRQTLTTSITFSMDVHSLDIGVGGLRLEDSQSAIRVEQERVSIIEMRRPSSSGVIGLPGNKAMPRAPSEEQLKRGDRLRTSAADLGSRSAGGYTRVLKGRSVSKDTAKGWIAEYNRLVGEAKSAFPKDPHVQALESLAYSGHSYHASGAVATAAKGLEVYMTSFVSHEAFRASAAALAERSALGIRAWNSIDSRIAKGWIAEYNRLVGEAKSAFPKDPNIQALKALSFEGNSAQASESAKTAAQTFGRAMENSEEATRGVAAEAALDAVPPSPSYTLLAHLPYSGRFSPDATKLAGLLGRWFSPDAKDENGWTDLHYAAALNLPGLASALLDAGADPDSRLKSDGEPFGDDVPVVLSAFGQSLSTDDLGDWGRNGQRPLHFAAWFNADFVAPHLVVAGAKVDPQTTASRTPLYLAAWEDSQAVAEFLIGREADVRMDSREGWTPLDYAIYRKASGTAALLRRHGGECIRACQ